MSDDWDFYICRVDDKPGSIFVDLGIRESAPMESLDNLVWLRLHMKSPRPDGLSSQDEFETLSTIEDAIESMTKLHAGRLQYVGRCTSDGVRDFYFYAAEGRASEQLLDETMAHFKGYEFETGSRADSEWKAYTGFLYPSDRAMQTIENQRVLEALKNNGDRPEVVREISHWIYFRDARARDEFASAVTNRGYREVSRDDDPTATRPHGITVSSRSDVLPASIHNSTLELFNLAQALEAEYDGWETSVER